MRRITKALALAALGSAALAAPAGAALNSPPLLEGRVDVFPSRDFVALDQWQPNTALHIRVMRNGFQVGEAHGTTDGAGFLEINHPGGVCWVGSTPNLIAGDVVQASTDAAFDSVNSDVDQTVTGYVAVTTHAFEDGGDIVMKGTAQAMGPNGEPLFDLSGNPVPAPIDQLEARIVAPEMRDAGLGDRDLNAPGGIPGVYTGTLLYDAPGSIHWTAVYEGPGLTQTIRDLAVAGESRIMHWMSSDVAGGRLGLTLYEDGDAVANGPGMPGCPAGADWAVTGSTPNSVNSGTIVSRDFLRINGVARNASAVSVTLDDEANPLTQPITVQGTLSSPTNAGDQTFFADVPMRGAVGAVSTLDDGLLTASAQFTVGERQVGEEPLLDANGNPVVENGDPVMVPIMEPVVIGGGTKVIMKDLTRPAAPVATPGEGTYQFPQSVELSTLDGFESQIRYTRNGSMPTATNGTLWNGTDLQITADQTVKAIVIDPAGNTSPIADTCAANAPVGSCEGWFRYRIGGPPSSPSVPDLVAASDSGESQTDNVTNDATPTFTGTAPAANLEVEILDGGTVVGTGTSASDRSYTVTANTLVDGTHGISARARNALGVSNPSDQLSVRIDTVSPGVSEDPPGGLYNAAQSVVLTSTEAGSIRYSRNGAAPDTLYTAPVTIASDTTLRFQSTDVAGNQSQVKQEVYTIDTLAPLVSLTSPLNGASLNGNVTITANASDANGIDGVQFRIDGDDFGQPDTVAPYSIVWDTRTVANGAHSISAVATDLAGNSAPVANGVAVNVNNGGGGTVTVAAPATALVSLGTANGTTVAAVETSPVLISWSATSTSGIASYQLQRSLNGGAFVNFNAGAATQLTQQLQAGTYQFRVRATPNTGAAVTGPTSTVVVRNDQETAATLTGAWTLNNAGNFWNGSLRFASVLNAQASYTFTGRSVGIVATRASNRGRFEVRIDGGAPTVVDLFNGALQPRRIVFQRALAAGNHTITVRVLGQRNAASTANRVDLDGFVVLN